MIEHKIRTSWMWLFLAIGALMTVTAYQTWEYFDEQPSVWVRQSDILRQQDEILGELEIIQKQINQLRIGL